MTTMQDPIELDGRTLEGGGQLIRNALCLSALTSKPVKITNIRGCRSGGGGLKAQHLACVKWLAHACNADVEGAQKGSKTLLFRPGEIAGGLSPAFRKCQGEDGNQHYECTLEIGTAGSTGLALQAILPYILFTRRRPDLPTILELSGGTNVSGSPSFDYIEQVLLPTLARIGLPEMRATCQRRGWSQGGTSIGSWTLEIPPRRSLLLREFHHRPPPHPSPTSRPSPKERPPPPSIHATLLAPSSVHAHVHTVLLPALTHHFPALSPANLTLSAHDSAHPKRLYLLLTATPAPSHVTSPPAPVLATDWLHERKSPSPERAGTEMAERVARRLADEWRSGAWVDGFLRDQLVVFRALAQGRSTVHPGSDIDGEGEGEERDGEEGGGGGGQWRQPSLHARTAEWVCRQMLGVRFDADGVCEGVGFGGEGEEEEEDGSGGVVKQLESLEVG